jgi:heptosyltransferase-2
VTQTQRRYLVVGPAWVGDMVMAQSLFITLRREHPSSLIDVIAPAWSAPLLDRMPEVRRCVALPVGHGELGLSTRYRTGRDLREQQYSHAIVLPRSLKSALVPFFARVPVRTGYRGEMRFGLLNDIRPLDKTVLTQTVQRFVALGMPADAQLPPAVPEPSLRIDESNRETLPGRLGLDTGKPVIGFMPGAEYGPAKQWPVEHFAAVAERLAGDGFEVWIFGSEKDRPVAEEITRSAGGMPRNLCGRTRLEDAIDLLSLCSAAVTNDSGLMHIAAAVGCPVVAVYGSSTPDYTPPLSERAEVIYRALECSPCFERRCRFEHTDCLRGIAPEQVLAALDRLMPEVRSA